MNRSLLWCAMTLAASVAAVGCGDHPGPTREITLVARGMTFMLAGESEEPNPTISLRSGERVRLILHNEAPGLLHDVAIPAWDVAVEQIRAGERAETVFVVPEAPGQYEYRCRPHAEMMRGVIDVQP